MTDPAFVVCRCATIMTTFPFVLFGTAGTTRGEASLDIDRVKILFSILILCVSLLSWHFLSLLLPLVHMFVPFAGCTSNLRIDVANLICADDDFGLYRLPQSSQILFF